MAFETKDLPRPPFLWTLDQVAILVGVSVAKLTQRFVHFQDLTVGPVDRDKFMARNIAPLGEKPEWRISETELLRWLRYKGFRPRYQPMY